MTALRVGVRRVEVLLAGHDGTRCSTASWTSIEGVVERGEAEAGDVGVAEVADDPAGDQRLDDAVRVRVAQRDLAAATVVLARGDDLEDARGRRSSTQPR